ncbi:MAG: hypothetical protein EVJ46_00260 [Candidatus Acididesulfobacter guangdongensis]|uniref:Cytochrome C n=1 Tax=Acididesulfobacter guangdongensis TaxID=2597225 RepID=A0A519BHI0_ACIG2|nr:MAG: hypothetical protein EVJ46_00260 [Candidatus Acididesulfobacter guangdongensis]
MKKQLTVFLIALFVLGVSFAIVPKKANAIPAFAQKYHFSCAVCHTVFPNLNPFGRAFWRNGFRLPGTNGTPADATQITKGLSLPNPWPVPIMIEANIAYLHQGNEGIATPGFVDNGSTGQTDGFNDKLGIVAGGAFKIYSPLSNSISFYVHTGATNGNAIKNNQVWASLNGLGSGFGIAPHLLNLKMGIITTASPYFYRQMMDWNSVGPVGNGQDLNIGYDGEAGTLIHAQNPGIELYGTPGYHLWYKVTMTNDAGSAGSFINNNPNLNTSGITLANNDAALSNDTTSNAMEYSYQLKEYYPVPVGQLEFGYYGATIAEPIQTTASAKTVGSWTDRVTVNGIDVDLANDIYELGATWMEQNDSNPYGPSNENVNTFNGLTGNNTINNTSNGYSDFEVYGRYLFPQVGDGLMVYADYATYSWAHKDAQEAFDRTLNSSYPNNDDLYQVGSYNGNDGVKDALYLMAEYNLAYNAHLYAGYDFTNHTQDNTLQTGLFFAF